MAYGTSTIACRRSVTPYSSPARTVVLRSCGKRRWLAESEVWNSSSSWTSIERVIASSSGRPGIRSAPRPGGASSSARPATRAAIAAGPAAIIAPPARSCGAGGCRRSRSRRLGDPRHHRDQLVAVDRLGDVHLKAGRQRLPPVLEARVGRQRDRCDRAALPCLLRADPADERVAEAQAAERPRARSVGLPEALEEVGEKLGRDAPARVANRELEVGVHAALQPDVDAPALGRELDRVGEEVPHHLLQPLRISPDQLDPRIEAGHDPDVLGRSRRPHGLARCFGHGGEAHRPEVEAQLPADDARDLEEVVDEPGLHPRTALDRLERSCGPGGSERTPFCRRIGFSTWAWLTSATKMGRFSAATRPAKPLPSGIRTPAATSSSKPLAARATRSPPFSSRMAAVSVPRIERTRTRSSFSSSSSGRRASAVSLTAASRRTASSDARDARRRSFVLFAVVKIERGKARLFSSISSRPTRPPLERRCERENVSATFTRSRLGR